MGKGQVFKEHISDGRSVEFHNRSSVDAFNAILPIIIGSHNFTELSTSYDPEGNSGASGIYPVYVFVRV